MKKNFFRAVVFSAFLLAGTVSVSAQNGYEVPPLNPEYAEMANQVIDLQLSDPDAANKAFNKLMRKIRKSEEDLLSVGQYFLEKGVYPCANQCSRQLYELAPTYIPGLMFEGEVCMMRKDYGAAGQKFDEVLALDSTNVAALKRNAFVYKNINPHVAIEMLQKIKRLDPSNYEADKELGDIAYNMNEFADAVNSYKSYFAAVPQDKRDVRAAENYLQSLYATQKFFDLSDLVKEFEVLDPNDMVFKRMKFFAAVENYELEHAKAAMSYIENKEYPDSNYLYLDYTYAGTLMKELNDFPSAIQYYEKAMSVDSTKLGAIKELATLYRQNKELDKGIETYKFYLKQMGDKAELTDYFGLGQQYLAASQQPGLDPAKRAVYVAAGDSVFASIQKERPNSYLAPLMRAVINISDPANPKPEDNVKAYYEEALKLMEGKDDVNSAKLQALRYLAFYAVQKDMTADARNYCDQILAIDANDATGKQIDAYLKSIEQ